MDILSDTGRLLHSAYMMTKNIEVERARKAVGKISKSIGVGPFLASNARRKRVRDRRSHKNKDGLRTRIVK